MGNIIFRARANVDQSFILDTYDLLVFSFLGLKKSFDFLIYHKNEDIPYFKKNPSL
jgi:hypothetical protein